MSNAAVQANESKREHLTCVRPSNSCLDGTDDDRFRHSIFASSPKIEAFGTFVLILHSVADANCSTLPASESLILQLALVGVHEYWAMPLSQQSFMLFLEWESDWHEWVS